MSPLEILVSEHRVILQVLSCLEAMIVRSEKEGGLDAGDGRHITSFLREYADHCHHGKEEEKLFPMLESRGMPAEGGPTGCMRQEHVQGRGFVGQMIAGLDALDQGDAAGLQTFTAAGNQFITLLRNHIDKENNVLFPLSEQMLGSDGLQELSRQFVEAEAGLSPGLKEKYQALAQTLAGRYGIDSQAAAQT